MSTRFEMYKSAMADMTEDFEETIADLSKCAAHKRVMYAKVKTNDPFPKHCYFCGTHDNVQAIEYGEACIRNINIILICPKCRKWFGNFLLSDKDKDLKEI